MGLRTFQDFEKAADVPKFVLSAIQTYQQSELYKTALLADAYDEQRNPTILNTIRTLYNLSGAKVEDFTASNHRIACNLFNRLNTQRCMYSLANGVSFIDPKEALANVSDTTKEMLGPHFDHVVREAAYHALIHGVSYLFWADRAYEFEATEFVPLEDEDDGTLRAGIRFWQLDQNKPMHAVLYEADGFTEFVKRKGGLEAVADKRAYTINYQYTDAGGVISMDDENYSTLPVVRMYASRLKQSTLVGMQEAIDAYDLIQSGFANDLTDCAQIYWIVENNGGMEDEDLREFLDRLKLQHIAKADTSGGGGVKPYTQEIPTTGRKIFLDDIRARIYEDFGALDVHTIAASATNDHIDAAYQPLDENAADFEHWVGDAIMQFVALLGVEDVPIFTRNRISNHKEQVEMLVQEAAWLDEATIIRKLPNLTPDERQAVMEGLENEDMARMGVAQAGGPDNEGE